MKRLVTILAVLLLTLPAAALAQKRDKEVRQNSDDDVPTQRVIIQTSDTQALAAALTSHGDTVLETHESIGAVTAEVHDEDLAALAADPSITSISIDAEVKASAKPGKGGGSDATDEAEAVVYQTVRATLGLTGEVTGSGVGIAVIDSGIKSVDDIKARISASYDFTGGQGVYAFADDDFGHGTHVAGLIGGLEGIAPGAHFIGMRVLDGSGSGRTSDVIAAIEYAVTYKDALGIDIINLSLGHPIYEPAATDPLVQAVEAASRAGIIVVTSAGNFGANPDTGEVGYAGVTSPGNAPSAITVGAFEMNGTAIRSDDRVADFSSRGPTWYDAYPKPDLVAPGYKLVSSSFRNAELYRDHSEVRVDASHIMLSGTSMASAVTAGVVALLLDANAGLTPNATKAALQGEFNWSSQHLDDEVLRWRNGNGDGQTEQVGLRCVRPVARESRGGRSNNGSGRRSPGGCRVRRPLCHVACLRPGVGRWFREGGGMPPISLAPPSARYLCFAEREEIAILRAQGAGVRDIARRVRRAPSTVSRELRRNAATRSGGLEYRASTAQWHSHRRAKRPKIAKLATNDRLRHYVQDRLAGTVRAEDGRPVPGPHASAWTGRRQGRRRDRPWATSWSPQQIAHRLRIEYPDDVSMRISHEAVYQALYIQGRGALRRELTACLRTGQALRVPRARRRGRGKAFVGPEILIRKRPPEVEDRAVPGHWEGDLIIGLGSSAIGTLVERTTRFTMLLHLPRQAEHGRLRVKNSPALAGHGAEAVRDAITSTIATLPEQLRRSLTWDQGAEMAQHARLRIDSGLHVFFCDPRSPWQRATNENTNGLLRQYFPKGTDLSRHSARDIAAVAATLNRRPRKTLSWRTPSEVFNELLLSHP